jgi:hypothetical protein
MLLLIVDIRFMVYEPFGLTVAQQCVCTSFRLYYVDLCDLVALIFVKKHELFIAIGFHFLFFTFVRSSH